MYLTGLIGAHASATLITATFWAMVGILVYLALWLFGNFSNVLSNDIVMTKYMHPRGDDTYFPLKRLLLRILFHTAMAVLFVLYINFFIGQLLPFFSDSFNGIPSHWSDISFLLTAGKVMLIEVFALHIFVVLSRLLLLRKRVFGLNI